MYFASCFICPMLGRDITDNLLFVIVHSLCANLHSDLCLNGEGPHGPPPRIKNPANQRPCLPTIICTRSQIGAPGASVKCLCQQPKQHIQIEKTFQQPKQDPRTFQTQIPGFSATSHFFIGLGAKQAAEAGANQTCLLWFQKRLTTVSRRASTLCHYSFSGHWSWVQNV